MADNKDMFDYDNLTNRMDQMDKYYYGPSKVARTTTTRNQFLEELKEILVNQHPMNHGKINIDTSKKPTAIWTSDSHRIILSEKWTLEIERNTGRNAMGEITWVRESGPAQREGALVACCIALLPEKIAENVVEE